MPQPLEFQRTVRYAISDHDGRYCMSAHLEDRLHDIQADLTTTTDTLEILTATVQFNRGPSPSCPQAEQRFASLVGLCIGRGLSEQLAKRLGGMEGCGNLRTMMLGLLPLAINARASQGSESQEQALEMMHQQLQGTCAGFPAEKK